MKFIIDYASLEKIKKNYDKFTVDNIASDSSIITKNDKKPYMILDFEKLFGQGKNMLNCK